MKKKLTLLAFVVATLMPMAAMAQDDTCTVTLPWSENFDSYTTTGGTTMPDCWTRVSPFQVNPGSNTALRPNLNTAYNHGTVLDFMGQGSGQGTMKIATPLIPAPLNAIEIGFQVYKNGLQVYLATDPADESTYTLVGSYSPGYVWTTYEVRTDTLTGAPAEQGYIVFAAAYGSSGYGNAYLDNLTVVSLNSCERPTSVSVENVGPGSATVSWPAVDGVGSYQVSYGTVDNLDSVDVEHVLTVASTSTVVDELEPGMQYYVWVQSICADGVSDARTATFTTQQACYSILNLTQTGSTFEAASFSWEYSTLGNAVTGVLAVLHDETDPEVADVPAEVSDASSFIFVNLDNTHQYTVTLFTICGSDTAEGVSSGIYFRNCGESPLSEGGYDKSGYCPIPSGYDSGNGKMLYDHDILYGMDTILGIALHRAGGADVVTRTLNIYMGHTTLDSLTSEPGTTGLTQVAANHQYALALQEWDTLMFDSAFVYDGTSNVLVLIYDVTGSAAGTGNPTEWYWHTAETKTYHTTVNNYGPMTTSDYHRPDIRFVGLCNNDHGCEPPVVAVGNVDSVNAEIGWFGADAEYIVEYRQQGETEWTVADTIAATSLTLTDLQSATYYEVRVGIVCDELVRYSAAVPFVTECALMHLPFHFTQANMSTVAEHGNSFSSCWSFSEFIYKGKLTNSHRGYVRNVDHNQWIMLPAIAESLSGARLRTWVASGDHSYFAVGVVENGDINTAVWLDTIEVNASNTDVSHDEYICYLDQYTGNGNRIVIQPIVNNVSHYMYFFDFHIEPIEDCMPVRNLTLDSANASSLSFHWTPRGAASEWIVSIDGSVVDTVSSANYTATGLQPYTMYTVGVSSLCSEGASSDEVSADFRTGCEGDECFVNLVGHSSNGEGWYGAHLLVYADSTQIENFTLLQGSDKSTQIRVCSSMVISLNWLSGNDDGLCSFELMNDDDTIYSFANGSLLDNGELFATDSICTFQQSQGPDIPDTVYFTVSVNYNVSRGIVTGAGTYPQGSQVTLTATPFDGYRFAGWSNGETDSVLVFLLNANITLTASFEENVGIDIAEGPGVGIAPNPATTSVTLSGLEAGSNVSIVDACGREVYHAVATAASHTVDVTSMAKGAYVVRVVGDNVNSVSRLIIR